MVLVLISLPSHALALSSKTGAAISDIYTLEAAVKAFYTETGWLLTQSDDLEALTGRKHPSNRAELIFYDGPLIDPWGTAYAFIPPQDEQFKGLAVYSAGPDRLPNTADDITRDSIAPRLNNTLTEAIFVVWWVVTAAMLAVFVIYMLRIFKSQTSKGRHQ